MKWFVLLVCLMPLSALAESPAATYRGQIDLAVLKCELRSGEMDSRRRMYGDAQETRAALTECLMASKAAMQDGLAGYLATKPGSAASSAAKSLNVAAVAYFDVVGRGVNRRVMQASRERAEFNRARAAFDAEVPL